MPIIGNNFWRDAGAYGEGAGDAISQALIQAPIQRLGLQQQLGQMQLERQRFMSQQALAQQGLQQRGQYQQGVLGLREGQLQESQRAHDLANMIQGLRAQIEQQHYGAMDSRPIPVPQSGQMYFPNGGAPQAQSGGVGTGQMTQQGVAQNPPNPQGFTLASVGQPGQKPMTQNQQIEQFLNAAKLYAGVTPGITNDAPFRNSVSNVMYQGQLPQQWQAPQQQAQMPGTNMPPSQGVDTNAIMQQAQQAIQQGANPMAVKQRLQQKYGLTMP